MSQQWYIKSGEKALGPFTSGQLRRLAAAGKLTAKHQLSLDQQRWFRAENVNGLVAAPPSSRSFSQKVASSTSEQPTAPHAPNRMRVACECGRISDVTCDDVPHTTVCPVCEASITITYCRDCQKRISLNGPLIAGATCHECSRKRKAAEANSAPAEPNSYGYYVGLVFAEFLAILVGIPLVFGLIGLLFGHPVEGLTFGAFWVALALARQTFWVTLVFVIIALAVSGPSDGGTNPAVMIAGVVGTVLSLGLGILVRAAQLMAEADKPRLAARTATIAGVSNSTSVDELLAAFRNGVSAYDRSRAAGALGALGAAAKVAVPFLVSGLEDQNRIVRSACAFALGQIGPAAAEAIPALREATADSVPTIQRVASEAIAKISASVTEESPVFEPIVAVSANA
jgi:hypothetical protein